MISSWGFCCLFSKSFWENYLFQEQLKVGKDLRVEQSFEDLETAFDQSFGDLETTVDAGEKFSFDAIVQLKEHSWACLKSSPFFCCIGGSWPGEEQSWKSAGDRDHHMNIAAFDESIRLLLLSWWSNSLVYLYGGQAKNHGQG